MTAPLTTAVAARVARIMLMLSSNEPGEVIAAAAAIERVLKSAGADWHTLARHIASPPVATVKLADPPPKAPEPEPSDEPNNDNWRQRARRCAAQGDHLSPRDGASVARLVTQPYPATPKQRKCLPTLKKSWSREQRREQETQRRSVLLARQPTAEGH